MNLVVCVLAVLYLSGAEKGRGQLCCVASAGVLQDMPHGAGNVHQRRGVFCAFSASAIGLPSMQLITQPYPPPGQISAKRVRCAPCTHAAPIAPAMQESSEKYSKLRPHSGLRESPRLSHTVNVHSYSVGGIAGGTAFNYNLIVLHKRRWLYHVSDFRFQNMITSAEVAAFYIGSRPLLCVVILTVMAKL